MRSNATLQILNQAARWRSRDVRYYAGEWDDVLSVLPHFELTPFRAGPEEPPNPFLRTVVRRPLSAVERPMPVGVVSHRYALVQHRDVAARCREGLAAAGMDAAGLRYEVGVSALGEWMHLRVRMPDECALLDVHGEKLDLRLECCNAVDGWSRLRLMCCWERLVCSNGMIATESTTRFRERHGEHLEIDTIPERVASSLDAARAERSGLERWQREPIDIGDIPPWIDGPVTARWGKKAAARVLHICRTAHDVEIEAFAPGAASEKPVRRLSSVPGSPSPARTRYDVAQALSYVATCRKDHEERLSRQADIPALVGTLPVRHV